VGVLLAPGASANLRSEMDEMLDGMSNYTEPGIYQSQRRGVIAGGAYHMRSPIRSSAILNVVPPSFEAGCGGIDLFGGSFSYINSDRLVQLLRSVASNAVGYSFQVALNAMCPSCLQTMENLQKKLQSLNELSANSCQLAQGLVTDTAAAVQGSLDKENSKIAQTVGGWGDTFQSFFDWGASPQSPSTAARASAPAETARRIEGNLVWNALNDQNVGSWFTHGGKELLEAILSLTGSVIVGPPQASADGKGSANEVKTLPSLEIGIRDLIYGGEVRLYHCDDHRCLNPSVVDADLEGFKAGIERILLGGAYGGTATEYPGGLIYKMSDPAAYPTASGEERGFLAALPQEYGTLIRNLAALDRGAAYLFVSESSAHMALDMARLLLAQLMKAGVDAAAVGQHVYAGQVMALVRDAQRQLTAESLELESKLGKESVLAKYAAWRDAARASRYAGGSDYGQTRAADK
jgi:conjugative transfer pilus assembly protein TraH